MPESIRSEVNEIRSSYAPRDTPEARDDLVTALPGIDQLDFPIYAGYVPVHTSVPTTFPTQTHAELQPHRYITVDADAGRSLFYTLVESASPTPHNDPLILWLNGGPGCSSLGGGFLSELGPFYPTPHGVNLIKNDYSWNQMANVLFLESPAGVGWSYSNTTEDYIVGDQRTAEDSYSFLLHFLKRFPRYRDRPFWLAGESYAGHYLPNLALQILRAADNPTHASAINFQGFMLGNPLTKPEVDSKGALQFWYTHGIISEYSYRGVLAYCDFAAIYPLMMTTMSMDGSTTFLKSSLSSLSSSDEEKCDAYVSQAMSEFQDINIYDVYADVCLTPPSSSDAAAAAAAVPTLRQHHKRHQSKYDPCIDNEVEVYLNRADVQAALHANASGNTQPGPWVVCTPRLSYSRDDVLTSLVDTGVYEELLSSRIQILVYSGDIDAIIPVIGTRRWVRELNVEVKDVWRPWYGGDGQVAGWTVGYSRGLRFASVRGAGHMVPYTQPARAFEMVSRFVGGKEL